MEVRKIEEAIRRCGQRRHFEIKSQWALQAKDLWRSLLEYTPQIVHFSGHGAGEEGLVALLNLGMRADFAVHTVI